MTSESAFTLIEVMIALVAFGIILSAINGVFWGALKLRNKSAESIDAALPMERTLNLIRRDLANIAPPGGLFFGQFQTTSTSTNAATVSSVANMDTRPGSGSPQFYTTSGLVDDSTMFGDAQMVSYSLVEATNRDAIGRDLCRNVTRNLLPSVQLEVVQQHILAGVESIYFYYCDGTTWKEAWDTNEVYKLPRAIKVQISMATEKGGAGDREPVEIIVPLVDAGTNVIAGVTQ